MKKVVLLGASGNLAKNVIDVLKNRDDIRLTLFLRNTHRLKNKDASNARIIEGDVLNSQQIKSAIAGKPEKGSVVSQKSLATLISKIIESPEKYTRESLGVSKPNS